MKCHSPASRLVAAVACSVLAGGVASAQPAAAPAVAVAPVPPAMPAAPSVPATPAIPAPPASPAPPAIPAPPAAVDTQLAAAQQRLEAAAREVAELSMRAGGGGRGDRLVFAGEPPRRAILGVQVDPAGGREGARVLQVSPGGPAAAAGLRPGDLLQSIGGTDLRRDADPARALVERMAAVQPDEKLDVKLLRDGRVRSVQLTARRSPRLIAVPGPAGFALPARPAESRGPFEWRGDGPAVAGLELASMTVALGRYFGTDKGVLVVRAPREATWQLEDGDVILAIDGREPSSGSHASRILRSYQAGEALRLRVMRQRKPLELRLTVPEAERLAERRVQIIRMRTAPGALEPGLREAGEPLEERPTPQ